MHAMFDRSGEQSRESETPTAPQNCGALEELMALAGEASTVFMARFPDSLRPALKPAQILQDALEGILPEPCAVSVVPFSSRAVAAVVTPDSARAFDPLAVHSLLDLLRRALSPPLSPPSQGGEAGIVPSARGGDRGGDEADPLPPTPYSLLPSVEIVPLARVSAVTLLQENLAALNELLETLIHKRMGVQFQPIVSFAGGRVFGYEALMRAPQEGALKRLGLLFQEAERARVVSWLDVACQERCFEAAARAGVRDHLFINMDAEGLAYLHDAERSLADRAAEFDIAPGRIVLEITERQTVEDFPRLVHYIEELRARGFKLAIDDAGDGYNSLRAIAELRPDFVKIARSLVKNLESNGPRRALLSTLTQFAARIGAAVIAEGIETRDELATVIEMGADFGQGYLLGKPNDGFKGLRREMREFIAARLEHRRRRQGGSSYAVGDMALCGVVLPSDTPADQVGRKFTRNPDLESVVLVDEERIAGLMMRDRFERAVAADPEALSRPIALLMDRRPLVVEADMPLEEAARHATFRPTLRFPDDILVARGGLYAGVVPVRALLEAVSALLSRRMQK
jgi:EAL domain-containing protein (putative c-di-GMP-specific phosphodiesterase class I)